MLPIPWKTFIHPHKAFRLEYPAHWDQVQKDNAQSCGFGPHERDDVGLWISIMPYSLDTTRMTDDLPKLMQQALEKTEAGAVERDPTLRNHGLKADLKKEGEGGHHWMVAGGDLVLFATSQVPTAERDEWNPIFARVMASLQITRDNELLFRQLANEVLSKLRERYPDQEFQHDDKGIRGKQQLIYLSNLLREIKESPTRRDSIIEHFVSSLGQSSDVPMGEETWEEARACLLPVLKHKDYFKGDGPSRHQLRIDWLADVKICYALKIKNLFRFVTNWDVGRWETDNDTVHKIAIENLVKLSWPRRLEGSRQRDGGRIIIVDTGDSLASSRLLNPELYQLFSGPLGSPFYAGIPDRDTLVLFSNRRSLKQRISRTLTKDCRKSAYPITDRSFLVTADGIAAG
jgi:uncharacterized protein YtpQ (UPF0354 family)